MSTPHMEEDGILREWSPLSHLLQEIPLRSRRGLFLEDVKLTCVDAVNECIVVGTSTGVVFWYDRTSHIVKCLSPEKSSHAITCVKVVSTVDFMVAAGDQSGVVTIFRVPKPPPDWLPVNKRKSFEKSVDRYTVSGIHLTPLTSLEWSLNGQKLFSGDSKGIVGFTEIDFCMNLSKAREILNERYSVVQLSYSQQKKALIVSTVLRCIICFREDQIWRVLQVGQKERNSLLALGGVFYTVEGNLPDPLVYSCRPGLRLWHADLEGCVQQTVMFKEAMKNCNNPVRLLRPIALSNEKSQCEFGRLLCWRDGLLVSHNHNTMVVIDPIRISVVATFSDVKHIASVATTLSEIFVICGDRDLLRLSYTPDMNDNNLGNVATGESVSVLPHFTPSPVTGTIMDPNFRTRPTNKLVTNTPEAVLCASEVTYGTDTVRLPPVVALHDGVVELRVDPSRFQQLNAIGEQGFDEIIYEKSERRRSRKKSQNSLKMRVQEGGSSTSLELGGDVQQPVPFDCYQPDGTVMLENEVPVDIMPDLRSIASIAEDVKQKEKLLEESLIFPINSASNAEIDGSSDVEVAQEKVPEEVTVEDKNPEPPPRENVELNSTPNHSGNNNISIAQQQNHENLSIVLTESVDSELEEKLNIKSMNETQEACQIKENGLVSVETESFQMPTDSIMEISDYYVIKEANEEDGITFTTVETHSPAASVELKSICGDWMELSCPDKVLSISGSKDHIVICCPRMKVYYSTSKFDPTEYWQKIGAKAEQFSLSPEIQMACKIHGGVAQYSRKWEEGCDWETLCRGVNWTSVAESGIWYTTNGELFNLPIGSSTSQLILCEMTISKVYAFQTTVIVFSLSEQMMIYEPGNWRVIPRPGYGVKHISLGPRNLVWLVDTNSSVFLTDDISVKRPVWWQVIVGNGQLFDISAICTTDESLFLGDSARDVAYVNSNSVTGYKWDVCDMDIKCLQLTAEGVFEDKGSLWILSDHNHLVRVSPFSKNYQNVSIPCSIVCVASAPQALWVLSDDGNIFVRQGISDANPGGSQWRRLNLEQIDSRVQLSHISCGCDVVWGCDIRGNVWMLVGSPHSIATDTFSPAWVPVEGTPLSSNTFTKVYVGPQSHMVWALDNAGNVYVREAIFPDFLIGTGWVHVYGIKASHLSISDEAVWALSKDCVYKRLGISQSNYIGDCWVLLSAQLDHVSASVSEGLWGICSKTHRLLLYCDKVFPISSQANAENDWTLL